MIGNTTILSPDENVLKILRRTRAKSSLSSSLASSSSPSVVVLVTVRPGEVKEAKTWSWAARSFGISNYLLVTYDRDSYDKLPDKGDVVLADNSCHPLKIYEALLSKGNSIVLLNAKEDLPWVERLPSVLEFLSSPSSSGCDMVIRGEPSEPYQEYITIRPTRQGQAFLKAITACHHQRRVISGDLDDGTAAAVVQEKRKRGLSLEENERDYSPANYEDLMHSVSLPSPSLKRCMSLQMEAITIMPATVCSLPSEFLTPNPGVIDMLIHRAINYHTPTSPTLHVIFSVTNPGRYESRYVRIREFIERMERRDHHHVQLHIVEMVYEEEEDGGYGPFNITEPDNPHHLQLRTKDMMWHKENLINIGVRKLLPPDWKAMAWVDAELEFESPTWALDTLKILTTGCRDVVQLFTHGLNLDARGVSFGVEGGFGFFYSFGSPYQKVWGPDWWHPGYAWAMSREGYEIIGRLYQYNIVGGGDEMQALSMMGYHGGLDNMKTMKGYIASPAHHRHVVEWERGTSQLRIGYTPGVVKHHFHGERNKRGYYPRQMIVKEMAYDPATHVKMREGDDVLVPTEAFPPESLKKIRDYFKSREEDEGYHGPRSYQNHPIREALENSKPIDKTLHVIVVIPPQLPPEFSCQDLSFGCMRQGRESHLKAALDRMVDTNYYDSGNLQVNN